MDITSLLFNVAVITYPRPYADTSVANLCSEKSSLALIDIFAKIALSISYESPR